MNYQAALAVFVKTPGLSPVKTRLAEGLGRECAEEFFRLSLAAVEATMAALAEAKGICPYWAVAEEAGLEHARWQRFPRVQQGSGGLGERLGRVFDELLRRHESVLAIGADSPQLSPEDIQRALCYMRQEGEDSVHVLGRCHDGGFYLLGTNHSLPPNTFRDVPYSTSMTAARLARNLRKQGRLCELATLSDVDRSQDLAAIADELKRVPSLSREQQAVFEWVVAKLGTLGRRL